MKQILSLFIIETMNDQENTHFSKETGQLLLTLHPSNYAQTVLNDEWLDAQSKSRLIKTIKTLASRQEREATEKIKKSDLPDATFRLPQTPLHLEYISDEIVVPTSARSQTKAIEFEWELLLFPTKSNNPPLRLRVLGDFTVGRQKGSKTPDLDLSPFGQDAQGVSRQHASVRATPDGLFLVDLGSINGTYYKARRLEPGDRVEMSERGSVAFGPLVFSVAKLQRKR